MSKMLRMVLAGLLAVVAMGSARLLQAQVPDYETVFFCGLVGGNQSLVTTVGTNYSFASTAKPTFGSMTATSFWLDNRFIFSGSLDANLNFNNLSGTQNTTFAEPEFLSGTVNLVNGTTPVGTQEIYVVIFSTVVHRDAFLYYI